MSKATLEKLLATYQTLTLPEQQVLQLLAFFAVPVARSPLVAMLAQLRVRFTPLRAINAKELVDFFAKAGRLGLMVEKQGNFCCQREIQFPLIRDCQRNGRFDEYSALFAKQIANDHYRSQEHALQLLRLGFFMHDLDKATTALSILQRYYSHSSSIIATIFPEPLDTDWIFTLPPPLMTALINALLVQTIDKLNPTCVLTLLDQLKEQQKLPDDLAYSYPIYLLLQGRFDEVEPALAALGLTPHQGHRGMLALLQGKVQQAIGCFEQELTIQKKQTGKRKIVLPGVMGLLHVVALLSVRLPQQLSQADELAGIGLKRDDYNVKNSYTLLKLVAEARSGNTHSVKELKKICEQSHELSPLTQLIRGLCGWWQQLPVPQEQLKTLRRYAVKAREAGLHWLAAELKLTAWAIDPIGDDGTGWAQKLAEERQMASLAGLARDDQKDWERSIKALLELGGRHGAGKTIEAKPNDSRLIWLIGGNIRDNYASLLPVEQKLSAKGWSRGRNVALKRLAEESGKMPYLTNQDRAAAACIRKERSYGYYSQTSYEFNTFKALKALIGHPLVFNGEEEPMSVTAGTFTLAVIKKGKELKLTLTPSLDAEGGSFYHWESPTHLLVYEPTPEQRRIAGIIGNGLIIPQSAEQQVAAAITAISPHVMVQADLQAVSDEADSIEADNRLHILLRPSGEGIRAELRVRPFGEGGPLFRPGQGGSTVIAEVGGKKLHCRRNIALEKQYLQLLMEQCSTFDLYEQDHEIWRIEDPGGTLELLDELRDALKVVPDTFVLHWPEGERFKLKGRGDWKQLRLKVSSQKEWLSLEGELTIAEDEVLSLQRLLELAHQHDGRFIQLAEGQFLALTEEFRRKLNDLQRLLDRHGKAQRLHQLSGPLLDEALSGAGSIKGDKGWKHLLERFQAAQTLQPAVPPTLQAELREYQQEGYVWLSRLAHWGVGACLADDMGLGKTVQALALLLTRAPAGPALVLAPTSVCLNWEIEARRFAPTLTPRLFGPGDRSAFVASLQPFDLAICSYTLFQQEAELLTGVTWETVVLDEAQAIKNMTTKRSQAAMQLKAGFRIATTGTPVENRLDELWNLFRFLNPGLLGSHQTFTERFGTPIERNQDKTARTLLKKLIRPFILRRTKSQVLDELPPRTDIIQRVELSVQEMAFYEALRRTALEKLAATDDDTPGARHLRILAEIMRLRRACCNPSLVMPDCGIGSAKLTAFLEILQELRDNGHRALVFSQFVDHLNIIRATLDQQQVSYQYLDGSTPQKERQERVNAFQAGQGELFLISLKAGGTGLNLTAADYVIHLDPWWNPAVEDQASDRAHRIGQQRPVTVYRLVAAGTIEEKIVALHSQKRELADSLLDGTESAARVSADDLLELLREAG